MSSKDIPPNPVDTLEVISAESENDLSDAGLYFINASSAAPIEHHQTERYPTAFVIRVSPVHKENIIKYIIMVGYRYSWCLDRGLSNTHSSFPDKF